MAIRLNEVKLIKLRREKQKKGEPPDKSRIIIGKAYLLGLLAPLELHLLAANEEMPDDPYTSDTCPIIDYAGEYQKDN